MSKSIKNFFILAAMDVIAKKDEFKKCREDNDVRIYGTTSMFGAALESGSKWDSLLK